MKRYFLSFPVLVVFFSFLGSLAVVPTLVTRPETSSLKPDGRVDAVVPRTGGDEPYLAWPGPRAEARREILSAPLFTEDRALPPPFSEVAEKEQDAQSLAPVSLVEPPPMVLKAPQTVQPPPEQTVEIAEPAEPETVESDPLVLPDLKLMGTFIAEDMGIARALLAETGEGAEETWVDVNGAYADWVLEIVSPEAVLMRGGEQTLALELFDEEPASE